MFTLYVRFMVVYSTTGLYVFFILSCTKLKFGFVYIHSKIVPYVLFILFCTTLQFGFVCSLFEFFLFCDTNNITFSALPELVAATPYLFPFPLKSHCWCSCSVCLLSTVYQPTFPCTHWFHLTNQAYQDCPSKPFSNQCAKLCDPVPSFFRLPAPPSHFRNNTPSAVSQSHHSSTYYLPYKRCDSVLYFSSYYLPLQAIFEPTRQAL